MGERRHHRACAMNGRRLRGFAKLTRDLSERKRTEALEARRSATGRDARGRAQCAHSGAACRAYQRRVSGHAVARTADATECHFGMDANPAKARDSETRGFPAGDGDNRTQYAGANAAHRRFARFEPNHVGANSPRCAADSNCRCRPRSDRIGGADRPSERASVWKAFSIPRGGIVSGDPARLQQIVWNLLSNAIKFTPKGGKVQVLLQRINSHIEFSVSDTGIGIPASFLPHVFDRFSQKDSSTTRSYGGLGLGLAISKQLVELHGGTLRGDESGRRPRLDVYRSSFRSLSWKRKTRIRRSSPSDASRCRRAEHASESHWCPCARRRRRSGCP